MEPFTKLTGVAAPLLIDDINSDQLAPSPYIRSINPDFHAMFLAQWRKDPSFVLSQPRYQSAKILVGGRNFGCGSAREAAVWSMVAFGIKCVVARSFPDVYRENCLKNGVLPIVLPTAKAETFEILVVSVDGNANFTIDLAEEHIIAPDGTVFAFSIRPGERMALLEGLDEISATLQLSKQIESWEAATQKKQPWLQRMLGPGQR